jgi:hypothetical protein
MVSTRTIIIGARLAIAGIAAYFIFPNHTSESISGQLARVRLGQTKPPNPLDIFSNETQWEKTLGEC